ncbi:MAG: Ig-like domain-containing protein [Rubricoccaceae bacterium]
MSARPLVAALALLLALAGCATPGAPSGGPEDRTPPAIEASAPADGSLRVPADAVLAITFSERVDLTSLRRALRVTPAFEAPLEVRLRGRVAEVRFPAPLRANTTYRVVLTTDLRDARGVPLAAPLAFAFSTGDRIDRGRLEGTVRDPVSGRGVPGLAVAAYRLDRPEAPTPDVFSAVPDYRTQTDAQGRFELTALAGGAYFVAAGQDRAGRGPLVPGRFAAPPEPAVRVDSPADTAEAPAQTPPLALLAATRPAAPPEPRLVRALSDRRVAVRFSQPVRFDGAPDPTAWTLTDSLAGTDVPVASVYQLPSAPAEVVVEAARALRPSPHRLALVRAGTLADSASTAPAPFARTFTPSAQADAPPAARVAFLPAARDDSVAVLRPDAAPGVRFERPPGAPLLARAVLAGPDGAPLEAPPRTPDGVTFFFDVPPTPGRAFTLRVPVPGTDSVAAQRFTYPAADALGSLTGTVPDAAGRPVIVEAYPDAGLPYRTRVGPDGRFRLDTLPPGAYRLRLFADLDGDGTWSGGSLVPYAPPEPLRFAEEPVRVRARWETDAGALPLGL